MSTSDDDDTVYILTDDDLADISAAIKLPYPTRDDGPVFGGNCGNCTITSIDVIDDFSTIADASPRKASPTKNSRLRTPFAQGAKVAT